MYAIVNEADLDSLLAAPLAVLYKHSPICPTSSVAYDEMVEFLRRRSRVPVFLVDVIRYRPLSRALAERTGVAHASPQAIILREGVAAWHASHFEVQAEALARVVGHLGLDGGEED
ncbi:MAG: bacillithiol system redox-active protein YtxJ [Gemmatimonadota bacterium]|nr:bacillithiol system redox-active protein YtxJ [Gemmatimonadota bacterium]